MNLQQITDKKSTIEKSSMITCGSDMLLIYLAHWKHDVGLKIDSPDVDCIGNEMTRKVVKNTWT